MSSTIDVQGDISIHTENILPIIKKWLYSEQDIFIRELVSNAFDAILKRKQIALKEGIDFDSDSAKISLTIDQKEKTITISDNGLGMDADDIQKYINQIAFSGAEDFIAKYKDKDDENRIIGHFGLGFYSSFIVSKQVEIISLSYKANAQAVQWSCDGSTAFSIREASRKDIGTDIILHIQDDSLDYVKEEKVIELIKKYANYLPVDIQVNGTSVNDKNPLWMTQPSEVKDEEYKGFYKQLFPLNPEPLFWIHLNVDYPFNLKGILFFPKLQHELDASKGKIKLFCQQVFVTDDAKAVVPEFLTLLQGAIDCPDIPLNVSRSYLQNDPYVKKISAHIVKKVADKLNQLYKKDPESFASYWNDIHHFIKYGMMHDNDFYQKVKDSVIFPCTKDKTTSIAQYKQKHKDKLNNKVLYCSDKDSQAAYVNLCVEQGLDVIFFSSIIDSHFLSFLESKDPDTKFVAVDAELSEHLLDDKPEIVDQNNQTSSDKLKQIFEKALTEKKLKIKTATLKSASTPAMLLQSEQNKRLKEMSALMQGQRFSGLDDYELVLNSNNPIAKKIVALHDLSASNEKIPLLCEYIYALAKMSHTPLKGEEMDAFVKRSQQVLALISEQSG